MPSPFSLLPSLLPTYACLAVRTFLTLDAHPHPTSCPPNSKFTSVLPVSPELSSRVPKSFPKRNETLPRLASFVESRGLFLPPTLCSAQGQAHTLALSNEQSKQTSVFSFPDPLRTSQQRLPSWKAVWLGKPSMYMQKRRTVCLQGSKPHLVVAVDIGGGVHECLFLLVVA